ncbi:MAG: hotdog fold thioesterase [Chitinophagales bacterium]|nr:hotdog fold thioesterase [Chitinophagales bacterium]
MTMIWKGDNINVEALNLLSANTMGETLDIKFIEIGDRYLKATMPVDNRTRQPYGLLHGGASAVLAETVGSVASHLCIDREQQICVGLEINCNHIRGKKDGIITATAKPLHLGSSTHVWDIRIRDEREKLICVSRLTMAVLKKP